MTISIEYLGKSRTKLSYPDEVKKGDLAYALSCIYLHSKSQLESISDEIGLDFVKLAEDKIKQEMFSSSPRSKVVIDQYSDRHS